MKSGSGTEPSIKLTCLEDQQCKIYFEPWGTEYVLKPDDVFEVSSSAFSTGDVWVSYVANGISLTFTKDVPILVTDATGRVYPV